MSKRIRLEEKFFNDEEFEKKIMVTLLKPFFHENNLMVEFIYLRYKTAQGFVFTLEQAKKLRDKLDDVITYIEKKKGDDSDDD